jgi:hypothetical protein
MNTKPRAKAQLTSGGWSTEWFGSKSGLTAIRASDVNQHILWKLAALGRIKIVRGTTDRVLYSTDNIIIEISGSEGGTSTTSGALASYRVKSKSGDVLTCRTWDGTNEGTSDVKVAVNRYSRELTSETIAGTTYNYGTYTAIDSYNKTRISDDGSTTETQVVTPMWYVNGVIDVMSTNFSGVTSGGFDLTLIEVSPRCWAKRADLPS